jgi:uncharacterized protein (DUF736 family)
MIKTFNFNLFNATPKEGAEAPMFTKEAPADYTGSTRDEGVTHILGRRAVSKDGKKYIKVRCTIDGKVHFGALFKNDKKESENQPDFTGSLDLDDKGEERLRLAAWAKTGEKAGKYLSVSVSEFLKESAAATATATADDDIIF